MVGVDQFKVVIEGIVELECIGVFCMNIFVFVIWNNWLDIFVVVDVLVEKGWYVDWQQCFNCIYVIVMF